MPEIKQLFEINSTPGISRDGTELDGKHYSDGQWVRFQRGRPRKIGGYQEITNEFRGPIRNTFLWSKTNINSIYAFSNYGIQMVQVNQNGFGNYIIDRTPSTYTANDNVMWAFDTMYDAASGSNKSLILALPGSLINDIDDQTERDLYVGDVDTTGVFTEVTDVNAVASGGVFSAHPYAVLYGNNGKVTWSNANEPQNYTTGEASTARITGSKIIRGMSLRSGNGSGGLLWSTDSVIRMDYIGGAGVFKFSHLSRQSSILSANCVVEYDGTYYWVGRDRFLVCNGSKVDEIPNNMNLNWFFDGLNVNQRTKVWGTKIPRFGEIWWFFPRGEATECTHAVILNVREQTWYDIELARTAGFHQQVFGNPIMCGKEENTIRRMTVNSVTGSFIVGDIITGGSSGAIGTVKIVEGTTYYVTLSQKIEFEIGEDLTNTSRAGTATISGYEELYSIYVHDYGKNAIIGESSSAIKSWVTTSTIGLPTGGATQSDNSYLNRWTRLVRIEPDFNLTGSLTCEVLGKEFANSPEIIHGTYTISSEDTKIDMRIQARHLRLKFTSNESNGDFEMGKSLLHVEPGDIRS